MWGDLVKLDISTFFHIPTYSKVQKNPQIFIHPYPHPHLLQNNVWVLKLLPSFTGWPQVPSPSSFHVLCFSPPGLICYFVSLLYFLNFSQSILPPGMPFFPFALLNFLYPRRLNQVLSPLLGASWLLQHPYALFLIPIPFIDRSLLFCFIIICHTLCVSFVFPTRFKLFLSQGP